MSNKILIIIILILIMVTVFNIIVFEINRGTYQRLEKIEKKWYNSGEYGE